MDTYVELLNGARGRVVHEYQDSKEGTLLDVFNGYMLLARGVKLNEVTVLNEGPYSRNPGTMFIFRDAVERKQEQGGLR